MPTQGQLFSKIRYVLNDKAYSLMNNVFMMPKTISKFENLKNLITFNKPIFIYLFLFKTQSF